MQRTTTRKVIPQTPDHILRQIQDNLTESDLVRSIAGFSQEYIGRLQGGGVVELVVDLNFALQRLGYKGRFSPSHLNGAVPFPDEAQAAAFEQKYGVPSTLVGVVVPEELWSDVSTILQLGQGVNGFLVEKYLMKGRKSPLVLSGASIQRDTRDARSVEYQQVYAGFAVLSKAFSQAEAMDTRVLTNPSALAMNLEFKLLRDIVATKVLEADVTRAQAYATRKLSGYLSWAEHHYGVFFGITRKDPGVAEILDLVNESIRPRVAPAVEGAYGLVDRLGPALATPLMYALGGTRELMSGQRVAVVTPPLIGLANAGKYVREGRIRAEQVAAILSQKGYAVQAPAN